MTKRSRALLVVVIGIVVLWAIGVFMVADDYGTNTAMLVSAAILAGYCLLGLVMWFVVEWIESGK